MVKDFPKKNKKRCLRRHFKIRKVERMKKLYMKKFGYFLNELDCSVLAKKRADNPTRKKHWRYRKYKQKLNNLNTVDIQQKECYI